MRALVTGSAGFIGSHLCEYLMSRGDEVLGLDCFTSYYSRRRKEQNLASLTPHPEFTFVEQDLLTADLETALSGCDIVYHLAGQPGVRPSWGEEFQTYARLNILATQRLLEAARRHSLWKFVYASSSSIYGDAASYPTHEDVCPQPVSPYGVTKLAGEHLCELYRSVFDVPTVSLRLFTVYGPRQRPDMAFSRLVEAAHNGLEFPLFGDGRQTRDFTFVADVVRAMRRAALSQWKGVANIGGGSRVSMEEVIAMVDEVVAPVRLVRQPPQKGDVRHTSADIRRAEASFGWAPEIGVYEGLTAMAEAVPTRAAVGA